MKLPNKEALNEQTWPTWLLPEGFEKWYANEQQWRKDMGFPLLPSPPIEVIREILGL